MTMLQSDHWLIELKPLSDPVPPVHRIRRLLKFAGRDLRLRCVRVSNPLPPGHDPQCDVWDGDAARACNCEPFRA